MIAGTSTLGYDEPSASRVCASNGHCVRHSNSNLLCERDFAAISVMNIGERSFGSSRSTPSPVTPGALAVGATLVMVLCMVLGLFLHGAAGFLLFGVAATLAIYLVLISGAFVDDAARRRQPPQS